MSVHHGSRRLPSVRTLVATSGAALGAAAVLSGCSGQAWQSAAEGSPAAPTTADGGPATSSAGGNSATRSAAASRTAAVDTDSVQTDPPVTASDAAVVLTYADWSATDRVVQASAFAQGRLDAGATCQLTASRAGAPTVTGTPTSAMPGPTTTDCGALTLRLPSSASGTWKVTVVYTAKGARLTSNAAEVQVP